MGVGIRNYYRQAANLSVASNVFVSSGLVVPIAVGQKVHIRYGLFVNGSPGDSIVPGARMQFVLPAAPVNYAFNGVSSSLVNPSVVAGIVGLNFSNAFTVAPASGDGGEFYVQIDLDYENGVNAGVIQLNFAQVQTDTSPSILRRGSIAEVLYL